jgi:hypothetical protein
MLGRTSSSSGHKQGFRLITCDADSLASIFRILHYFPILGIQVERPVIPFPRTHRSLFIFVPEKSSKIKDPFYSRWPISITISHICLPIEDDE